MSRKSPKAVEDSSGDVIADLGFPHPAREEIKARLTLRIYQLIRERGLTRARAGALLGVAQPHVSNLMRGRFGIFSAERLMEFLTALDQDVEITIRPKRKACGAVTQAPEWHRGQFR